jgi:osmoprotectant transport system permease protein
MRMALRNPVLLVLTLIGAAAALSGGFIAEAPNRLVSGMPITIWNAVEPPILLAIAVGAVLLIAASFVRPSSTLHWEMLAVSATLLLLLLDGAGAGAERLTQTASPAARTSLGWAFWIMGLCAGLAIIDSARRLRLTPLARLLLALAIVGAAAWLVASGRLDQLSILREFAVRRDSFAVELYRHATLVIGALLPALAIGLFLAVWAARKPAIKPALFGTLNLLQTIPSVALFGLLIAPLSAVAVAMPSLAALGIGGIGVAPAIVALVLYALLPVARNGVAGIEAADPAVIEAARGMGFTARQIFWRAQLPLGLPIFLAGLRIVLVQTIGLAVIAALIGGGGLGTFIFQGVGQYAVDLVLLGAIPVTLLALATDFLLSLSVAALDRRRAA